MKKKNTNEITEEQMIIRLNNSIAEEKALIEEKGQANLNRDGYGLNTSSIYSKLITETGRFVEMHASDLFIDLKILDEDIKEYSEDHTVSFYWFGLRESGVDHTSFLLSRIRAEQNDFDKIDCYYRKIYCVKVIKNSEIIKATLYDNSTCKLATYKLAQYLKYGYNYYKPIKKQESKA